MEVKKKGRRMAPVATFTTTNLRSNLDKSISPFYFENELFKINDVIKTNSAKTFKNVKTDEMSELDEELEKLELENAVKNHKKNKCKHSETKCDVIPENNTSNKMSFYAKDIDDNDNDSKDLLELINYFRKEKLNQNKKPVTISDYERQGAIPKRKTESDSVEIIQPKSPEMISKKNQKSKKSRGKRKTHNEKDQAKNDLFCTGPKISDPEASMYNFIVKPNCDDVIVKINEEICSTPFFYIVPSNPSSNFFFSPGSYYIIPKMPDFIQKEVIIFHPERTDSVSHEQNYGLLKLEGKLHRVPDSSNKPLVTNMNNLGREVVRKEDSHLNIGPLDAKLNESSSNLETSHFPNKTYEKALFSPPNFSTLDVIQKSKPETKLKNRVEKTDFPIHEDNLTENADEFEMFERELMPLAAEAERQLERMILALPETEFEELQEKLFEFQGDENLIESYIQDTKQVMKNRQRVLDMQFIFPDADPDFLRQEIEKLTNSDDDVDVDDAINNLIDQLLDSKAYPKISEENLNSEKRILWRKYVENFSVQNFILKVSNPQHFAGPNGDHNKTNIELILKFLMSRYPSQSQNFLKNEFNANNNNLTKTCEALNSAETVKLAESSFQNEAFNEDLLKEICYIDHREEIDNYLREMEERKNLEIEEARLNDAFLSCPLCMEVELVASEVTPCPEGHIFCKECIKRYICLKFSEGIYKFFCPSEKCDAFFPLTTLEQLLSESVLLSIIKKQQAEEISNAKLDGLEFCPFCEFAYIPDLEDKIFKCQNPECLRETCRKCGEKNHIPLRCEEIERSMDVEARKKIEETMTEALVRSCPSCSRKFVKVDGCNKMVCPCGTIMCYLCRKKIQDYDHFKENSGGMCPLFSDNQILHVRNVIESGIQARNDILHDNPNVRILHDPTQNENPQVL